MQRLDGIGGLSRMYRAKRCITIFFYVLEGIERQGWPSVFALGARYIKSPRAFWKRKFRDAILAWSGYTYGH